MNCRHIERKYFERTLRQQVFLLPRLFEGRFLYVRRIPVWSPSGLAGYFASEVPSLSFAGRCDQRKFNGALDDRGRGLLVFFIQAERPLVSSFNFDLKSSVITRRI